MKRLLKLVVQLLGVGIVVGGFTVQGLAVPVLPQEPNFSQDDVWGQVDRLQQQIQQLNGELEVTTHRLEQLEKKINEVYEDLNSRLELNAKAIKQNNLTGRKSNQTVSKKEVKLPALGANPINLKEQQFYQAALDLLPNKKEEGKVKLREYIKRYPKGTFVANAHYWLGEINFLQGNYDAAEEEFKVVLNKFSKGGRISESRLKIALIHFAQGYQERAKKELQTLIAQQPNSEVGKLAKQHLSMIK